MNCLWPTGGAMRLAILGASVLAGLAPAIAVAGPSFDCKLAKSPVEKAICADATLADLDQDMAQAYRQALQRVKDDQVSTKILRDDQRLYIASRNEAFGDKYFDMAASMKHQVEVLRSVRIADAPGFEGSWASSTGQVDIARTVEGTLSVTVSAAHVLGRWVCEFIGVGKLDGDRLIAAEPPDASDYDGWTLQITRTGRAVKVEGIRPRESGTPPYCGARGTLDGSYIAVSDEGHD